jgi:hypothetical protein
MEKPFVILYVGVILGSPAVGIAGISSQDPPAITVSSASPEVSGQPVISGTTPSGPSDAPRGRDDYDTLLLLLAAAAAGVVGAQMLPRLRGRSRRMSGGEFEDAVMTETDRIQPPDAHSSHCGPTQPLELVKTRTGGEALSQSMPETVPDLPSVATTPEPEANAISPEAMSPSHASSLPQMSAVDALRETRASHSHQSWRSFNRDALPRLLFYGGNKFCQFSAEKLHAADEWFVIGDIHGDFFALHTIVSHIRKACPQFGIIFLGDLIDRGPHPIECLWYLLKVADDHPERVLWLAGNHDVGVRYDETTGEFRSTVEPAEFVADLNIVDSFAPLRRAFGREYIELAEGLPRVALMPDGLLLTHGGFPHTDLQAELTGLTLNSDRRKWLESEAVIRDFTHLRITKYPLRRPNRLSISCSYGYRDFDAFKQAMTGYGIKRLVTGHQHAATGFDEHSEWAKNGHEALTLTGFGFADAYDRAESYAANYRRCLVIGRCRPEQIPEVVRIAIDEQDLTAFYEAEIKAMRRFAIS